MNQSLTFHCGCGKDCLDTYVCFKVIGKIHYSNGNRSELTQIYATYDEILRYKGQVRAQQLLFIRPGGHDPSRGAQVPVPSWIDPSWRGHLPVHHDMGTPKLPTPNSHLLKGDRVRHTTEIITFPLYVVIFSLIEGLIQDPP